MKNYALKDIDSYDIDDLLFEIETSFAIRFSQYELEDVTTFGQLCDRITDKMQQDDVPDCTSQQAFYKLREAMVSLWQADRKTITPDASIRSFLPRRERRSRVKQLEAHLGFKLHILRAPHWVTAIFVLIIIVSLVALFFNALLGIASLIFSIVGLLCAHEMGTELDLQTLGDLAKSMTRTNYVEVRRSPKTINKQEIHKVLTDWFSEALYLNKSELGRDAALI